MMKIIYIWKDTKETKKLELMKVNQIFELTNKVLLLLQP